MMRIFIGLLLGGAFGLAASQAVVSQLFGVDLWGLIKELDTRSVAFLVLVGLPLLGMMVRGALGFLVTTAILAGGAALAVKLYLQDGMPWEQTLAMTGVYAVVATTIYMVIIRRVFG